MSNNVDIVITKSGNYNPVDLFNSIGNLGDRKRLPKHLAKSFYIMLLNNIKSNKFGFQLSEFWSKYKSVKGWDNRPFIAEGHYLNNIKIFTKDGHLTVGFRKSDKHPRTGLTYGEIALILEMGRLDKNLPARPLWRNSIDSYFRGSNKHIREVIKNILEDATI